MQTYGNRSGDSGVVAYDLGDDYIAVRFKGGDVYRYTDASVGSEHVAQMKRLARLGRGLSTYISTHPGVRDHYASKEPDA